MAVHFFLLQLPEYLLLLHSCMQQHKQLLPDVFLFLITGQDALSLQTVRYSHGFSLLFLLSGLVHPDSRLNKYFINGFSGTKSFDKRISSFDC